MKHIIIFFLCASGLVSVAVSVLPYKFSLVMKAVTWSDAQSYCRAMYTDLATIVNATDWQKLEKEAARKYFKGPAWVGLTTFLFYLGKGCAVAYNGRLSQETCTNLHYFYCHTFRPETEQQIMRLQVESDASVFDPAVQSSILEKIKQKLEENGMVENITVTWQVKPDGNIFYKEKENEFKD